MRDVLNRQLEVVSVEFQPDSITKRSLQATIDPDRVPVPTGPKSPQLEVEWWFHGEDSYYRIHYHDPNTGFNCGCHRDEDHPDPGPVHFQYQRSEADERVYQSAEFSKSIPTEILWEAIERLFGTELPRLADQ